MVETEARDAMVSLGGIGRRMRAAWEAVGLRFRAGLPQDRRPGGGTLARILLAESVVP